MSHHRCNNDGNALTYYQQFEACPYNATTFDMASEDLHQPNNNFIANDGTAWLTSAPFSYIYDWYFDIDCDFGYQEEYYDYFGCPV